MTSEFQSLADEELARRSQGGSLVAFEELVYRYEAGIYRFVCNFCPNATDAREVTQDTFVRAFEAIAQFKPRYSFAAWLFTIARRKCIDCHRAAMPVADQPVPEAADADDPAELLSKADDRQNLWNLARQCLPAMQFDALWLRYAQDMDIAEIARVLGKTRTHVKVLLFRARRLLAGELDAGGTPGRGGATLAPKSSAVHTHAAAAGAAAPLLRST